MSTENPDVKEPTVEDKLKAAVETSTTQPVEKGTQSHAAAVEEPEDKPENRIPQSRFNEINERLKEVAASKDLLEQQLSESNQRLVKMAELLEEKDEAVQTLNEIKSFVNDPKMADHVIAIDKKLRGIEEEVERGETTPEEAQAKTQALLEKTREEIADVQATAQAEALVARADLIAEKLLAQLPETYDENDRVIVQTLWNNKMNWTEAVADPDNLAQQLTRGFQEALDQYGTPRGALFTADEVQELTPEPATVKTPEEELAEVMDQPWGALKTVEEGGKTKVIAEKSEDEFNAALAGIIRKANGR